MFMIKVLFFIDSLSVGGAEKSLISLLKHLDDKKYDIELYVQIKGTALENDLPASIKYEALHFNHSLISRFKFAWLRKFYPNRHSSQNYWKVFKKNIPAHSKSYDVAIGWGQGFATYYVADKVTAKKKMAWINTNYDEAGYAFEYDKSIYQKFDKINGVSPFAVEVMSKYIDINKLTQITDLIDNQEIIALSNEVCPSNFNPKTFNMVSVGRLVKPKGFELSIAAAKILQESAINFHWYIVGEGDERTVLEKLITEHGLKNDMTLVGFYKNPYTFMKQADLYVQTSHYEGLGRTLIEAAILKKPIVTTNFDTAFDLVKQDKTGFITEKNPKAIATAILKLNNEKDTYLKMVANLKHNSSETATKIINQFDDVIMDLLASN